MIFVSVCPFAMDLAFLMDASGSIGLQNYENMKKFINEVIDHFHVSSKGKHDALKLSDVSKLHTADYMIKKCIIQDNHSPQFDWLWRP